MKPLGIGTGPGAVVLRRAGDQNGGALIVGRNTCEEIRDLGIFINKNRVDAESFQIPYEIVLLQFPVLEFLFGFAVLFRDFPLDTVVMPSMLFVLHPDPAKDVVDIWIGEAKSKEEECFFDEISAQRRHKGTHLQRISFVVIFADDGVCRVINIAVHLVNDHVTIRPRDGELLQRVFHIRNFFGFFESLLNQFVVVRRPVGVDGQAGQNLMILCRRPGWREVSRIWPA